MIKKQSNKAMIWITGLLIAIPLFIVLALLGFVMATIDRIALNRAVKLV